MGGSGQTEGGITGCSRCRKVCLVLAELWLVADIDRNSGSFRFLCVVFLCVCSCLPPVWAVSLDSVLQGTSPQGLGRGWVPPTPGKFPDEILRQRFHSFMTRKVHRAAVGTCLATRASNSGGGLLHPCPHSLPDWIG